MPKKTIYRNPAGNAETTGWCSCFPYINDPSALQNVGRSNDLQDFHLPTRMPTDNCPQLLLITSLWEGVLVGAVVGADAGALSEGAVVGKIDVVLVGAVALGAVEGGGGATVEGGGGAVEGVGPNRRRAGTIADDNAAPLHGIVVRQGNTSLLPGVGLAP